MSETNSANRSQLSSGDPDGGSGTLPPPPAASGSPRNSTDAGKALNATEALSTSPPTAAQKCPLAGCMDRDKAVK
jgi:hypothetical protein